MKACTPKGKLMLASITSYMAACPDATAEDVAFMFSMSVVNARRYMAVVRGPKPPKPPKKLNVPTFLRLRKLPVKK